MIVAELIGPSIDWFALSPLLVLLGAAMVLLVASALTGPWPRNLYAGFTVAAAAAAAILSVILWRRVSVHGPQELVGSAMRLDHFALWITITICVAVAMAALITADYLPREGRDNSELYSLYMLSAIGGLVMGAANDLVVLFLGLEIMSIAMYVMAASYRQRTQSGEAGIKYFVLGAFSSAFFLYGVALIYGGSGSTNFDKILQHFNDSSPLGRHDAMLLAGVALLLVGLGFKVAAVPFHFWAPDVYEGAPTPVTAFLASVGKAGAFGAMLRVLTAALPQFRDDIRPAIWVIAVLTLVVGAAMAVVQTNVKRMLAFSSVNHAGFVLVGVEAAVHTAGSASPGEGVPSALLYLLLYAGLVTGTFAVVTLVGRTGDAHTDLAAFRGLARSRPALALALTVLLLAQAGVPLTSGFVAKFGVIRAGVEEHSYALAIIAMLAAVIAAFLYLRIMVSMWIADPEPADAELEPVAVPWTTGLAIGLAVVFALVVGFFPGWFLDTAKSATTAASLLR